MARIGSAHPREGSALAHPLTGLGEWLRQSVSSEAVAHDRRLQIAAALHLAAIAAAVLGPSSPPLPLFLTMTGLMLVVLALNRAQATAGRATPTTQTLEAAHGPQVIAAGTDVGRTRLEADLRGQLWAELTARMSHELRTPLNAVIGFSDMMSAELFGPLGHDRYRDYSRHIRECSRSLLKCTEDTLALTSTLAQSDHDRSTRTIRIDTLIREAAEFHAAQTAVRGVSLDLPAASALEILGEVRPLRQILINLIDEAHQRACRGATISVRMTENCDTVGFSIRVQKAVPRADEGQAPLTICIARVLLAQQGLPLVETDDHDSWQAVTVFHRPAQADFFTPKAQ
jgi:signal transduction histidine kinase